MERLQYMSPARRGRRPRLPYRAERLSWGLLAAGHALPAAGLLVPGLASSLYDVEPDTTTRVLLQHRGALFVAVVGACAWAAADSRARRPALALTALSVGSFLAVWSAQGADDGLQRVAVVDALLLAPLAHLAVLARRPSVP